MEMSPHVEALVADLDAVAAGDEAYADAARRLAPAVLELNTQITHGHVEVRLAGRDPQLVFVSDESQEPPPVSQDTGDTARISLRLPAALKMEIEAAAGREGVSVNA